MRGESEEVREGVSWGWSELARVRGFKWSSPKWFMHAEFHKDKKNVSRFLQVAQKHKPSSLE